AQDYFSYEVGMNIYLEGSRSKHLEKGFDLLREMSEKYKKSLLGAKLSTTVANGLTQPFFQVVKTDEYLKLSQAYKAEPREALKLTDAAVDLYRKTRQKSLNLSYRQLVSQRVDCLVALERPQAAVKELDQLHKDLFKTGANAPVLKQISDLSDTIGATPVQKIEKYHSRTRLWDRVRTHDELAAKKPSKKRARKKSGKKSSRR
ncbi:MAG TPA: hypothetical protein VFI71_10630, partial [Pyrinomonadaceae bacterium]|nr:hypothetical protein [Pyrinomonadaceae bacterium]